MKRFVYLILFDSWANAERGELQKDLGSVLIQYVVTCQPTNKKLKISSGLEPSGHSDALPRWAMDSPLLVGRLRIINSNSIERGLVVKSVVSLCFITQSVSEWVSLSVRALCSLLVELLFNTNPPHSNFSVLKRDIALLTIS